MKWRNLLDIFDQPNKCKCFRLCCSFAYRWCSSGRNLQFFPKCESFFPVSHQLWMIYCMHLIFTQLFEFFFIFPSELLMVMWKEFHYGLVGCHRSLNEINCYYYLFYSINVNKQCIQNTEHWICIQFTIYLIDRRNECTEKWKRTRKEREMHMKIMFIFVFILFLFLKLSAV